MRHESWNLHQLRVGATAATAHAVSISVRRKAVDPIQAAYQQPGPESHITTPAPMARRRPARRGPRSPRARNGARRDRLDLPARRSRPGLDTLTSPHDRRGSATPWFVFTQMYGLRNHMITVAHIQALIVGSVEWRAPRHPPHDVGRDPLAYSMGDHPRPGLSRLGEARTSDRRTSRGRLSLLVHFVRRRLPGHVVLPGLDARGLPTVQRRPGRHRASGSWLSPSERCHMARGRRRIHPSAIMRVPPAAATR
jgi:hypothetical protein